MKLIKLQPRTPGSRHQLKIAKNLLSKKNVLFKTLTYNIQTCVGRSTQSGQVTIRHRGTGCKKKFKKIVLNYAFTKVVLLTICYDPYRSSFISLSFDLLLKKFKYFLTTQSTFPGSLLSFQQQKVELNFGNQTKLENLPIGIFIHSLCLHLTGNIISKYARAAGTFCQIVQKQQKKVQIRVPSGRFINLPDSTFATFGRVSNLKHGLIIKGKAGRNRLLGFRPHVRGVAMNPVDHPHGGRTKGGRPSVSP